VGVGMIGWLGADGERLEHFKQQTDAAKAYRYVFWQDGDFRIGKNWHPSDARQASLSRLSGFLSCAPLYSEDSMRAGRKVYPPGFRPCTSSRSTPESNGWMLPLP
jgi:hypothetical protein